MLPVEILYEYENALLCSKKEIPVYFFPENEKLAEKLALDIIRYAIEKYLRWTPERAYYALTGDIIKLLKVEPILKYIKYPPEADVKQDLFIIVNKLYPNRTPVDFRNMTINIYKRVRHGDLIRFPKGFFNGGEGIKRATICFMYVINQNRVFTSPKEMYSFFATVESRKFLQKEKLNLPLQIIFGHPIEYLHESLPEERRNEFWYHYYKFYNEYKKRRP